METFHAKSHENFLPLDGQLYSLVTRLLCFIPSKETKKVADCKHAQVIPKSYQPRVFASYYASLKKRVIGKIPYLASGF